MAALIVGPGFHELARGSLRGKALPGGPQAHKGRIGSAGALGWRSGCALLLFLIVPREPSANGDFALGAVIFALQTFRVMKLRKNPGVYRVSIDDYGLYVHSDDPACAPSFSVIAPDLYRLIKKTIKYYDAGDEYEYYVETKSGKRHRIEKLFTDYDLDVMRMFERIMDRFPWAQVQEEVQR